MLRSVLASTAFVVMSVIGAEAAVFDFSFDNVDGGIAGTVTGQVTLADGDGTFAADSVIVTSAPGGLGYDPVGFDFTSVGAPSNSFTITGGAVTDVDFVGVFNALTALALSTTSFSGSTFLTALDDGPFGTNRVQDSTDSTLTFTAASTSVVPLPASIPLLAGALGMLGFVRRARKA